MPERFVSTLVRKGAI